jgi:adenosylhomocysteine nucleosidase
MTYIPDLTPYNYGPFEKDVPDLNLLAIGWLDKSVPYTKGSVEPDLLLGLQRLAANPVNRTRGYHSCQYCMASGMKSFDEYTPRGNGELHVIGESGIIYAAPVLICHYIESHEYKPPDEFLEAVRKIPEVVPPIAIIAALEHELHPLVKNWPTNALNHEGRSFTFHESDYAVAVCGGIGSESARRAAEAAIKTYSPNLLVSAGVAGSLVPELDVGETIFPAVVIDTQDGSRHETAIQAAPMGKTTLGRTVLVSYPEIATVAQKRQLAKSYGAHAVDMEAAAVARAAQAHNLPFIAVKAISDRMDFELPEMMRFIRNGSFQTTNFALHVAIRPWLWFRVFRLARNTKIASENLCAWLRESALTNTIVSGTQARAGTSVPPPSELR